MRYSTLDIFCHVIDNFGDIGVVYRFAREFRLLKPQCRVRVFIDAFDPLPPIDPRIDPGKVTQTVNEITFINFASFGPADFARLGVADVVIEAFACQIPEAYMISAFKDSRLVINLDYLSAEQWVEECHLKESLLGSDTLRKFFFMPGLTARTGGVIINSQLESEKADLVSNRFNYINKVISKSGIQLSAGPDQLIGTIFTYLRGFDTFLDDARKVDRDILLLVYGDKSQTGMRDSLVRVGAECIGPGQHRFGKVRVAMMPWLPQPEYDRLLCCADFNLVRGEDSLVRAIQAGKPFIWQAYLQKERYQKVKVQAFVDFSKKYFMDSRQFELWADLLMRFNDVSTEQSAQTSDEHYDGFFANLHKIERATMKMSYLITRELSLVPRFCSFIDDYPPSS